MNRYAEQMERLNSKFVFASKGESPRNLSEEEIQQIEQRVGYPLPLDYREFLKDYTGYASYPNPIATARGPIQFDKTVLVEVYLGLLPSSAYDIFGTLRMFKGVLPPEFLPIATAAGGLICLALAGERTGKVYYWWIHGEDEDIYPDYANANLLADSFDEFIYALQQDD